MKLSDRMTEYEQVYDQIIVRRIPVIVRIDGKGFSKYTKIIKAKKPFDESLSTAMASSALQVADRIEGCVFSYTQSDEASFVILNDQSLESIPWFGNRIQKIASITASMFTAHFNSLMSGFMAYFDARVFAVPDLLEAYNYLIWRQQDATRNSVQLASYYGISNKIGKKTTFKKLHGLNIKQQQELLFSETGINWNDYPDKFKRGIGIYKESFEKDIDGTKVLRSSWKMDENIPIFSSDKEFLKKILERKDELL